MRVARHEAKPCQQIERADVDEEEVEHVRGPRDVVWAAVGVPDGFLHVRAQPTILPRSVEHTDKVGESKVGACGHILGHHREAHHALWADDDVGLHRERVLGLHVFLRIATAWIDGQLLPKRAALVVALINGVYLCAPQRLQQVALRVSVHQLG